MKITSFQIITTQVIDQLGQQSSTMTFFGCGDDNKMYMYNFGSLEWELYEPLKPKTKEVKKPGSKIIT